MIFPRAQSLAAAAILAMTGAVLRAGDDQPQGGSTAPQTQPAAGQSPAASEGRQGFGFAAPAPAPRLDDVSPALVFPAERVTGFSASQPATDASAPPLRTPQNRALPFNADNAAHFLPGDAAYSPNWLVDGVARLEKDELWQRSENARDGKTDDATAIDPLTGKPAPDRDIDANTAGKSRDATNDPLVQYLLKWMETSSGAAAAAVASQPSGSGDAQSQYQTAPGNVAGVDSAISGATQAAAAPRTTDSNYLAAQMMQPMLEATGPSIVLPPPPIPQSNAAQTAAAAADPATTSPMTGLPENAVLKIKPIETEQEPTKPILNDKKYFPQMQRF